MTRCMHPGPFIPHSTHHILKHFLLPRENTAAFDNIGYEVVLCPFEKPVNACICVIAWESS